MKSGLIPPFLLAAFLLLATNVLGGTTGTLTGMVYNEKRAPLADALVSASSSSATLNTKTDAAGHFTFVSLPPDTYAVFVSKAGYDSTTLRGVVVVADNDHSINIVIPSQRLRAIATVVSIPATGLVKPGATSSEYSLDPATQEAVQSIGGGTYLDSAFGSITSLPGVIGVIGNWGFSPGLVIRGAPPEQIGFEFDGVPVNRAFDSNAATRLSTLGQQELQVYTGGGPAGQSSDALGGFVNQVIKSGTYPAWISMEAGVGTQIFYHALRFETGGASPNRLFSYYLGLGGNNQSFRWQNQHDAADFGIDGNNTLGAFGPSTFLGLHVPFYVNGAFPDCESGTDPFRGKPYDHGCWQFGYPTSFGEYYDREAVLNLHFGIPHRRDGARDDVQFLYASSANWTINDDSIDDTYGTLKNLNTIYNNLANSWDSSGIDHTHVGGGYCFFAVECAAGSTGLGDSNPVGIYDGYTFPSSTHFGQAANGMKTVPYFFPSSDPHLLGAPLPVAHRDGENDDSATIKLQYQHNIGTQAFLRLFGYIFYTDSLGNGLSAAALNYGSGFTNFVSCCNQPDYEQVTHTRGVQMQFTDQINAKHLITATANYTTATVQSFDNQTMFNSLDTDSTNLTDGRSCYDYTTGATGSCFDDNTSGTYGDPTRGQSACGGATPPPAIACSKGARWVVTVPGESGQYNGVRPSFASVSFSDELKPNDRLTLYLALRFDRFNYDLVDADTPENSFWFGAAAQTFCYDPVTLQPVRLPIFPGTPPPANVYEGNCAASAVPSSVHPDGKNGHLLFTSGSGGSVTNSLFSPRFGFTYEIDPDTVLRGSLGKFVQPTYTAAMQFLDRAAKNATTFDYTNFFGLGFTTPQHDLNAQQSYDADFSYEHNFRRADVALRVTPYYRSTTGMLLSVPTGINSTAVLNVGNLRSYGVEVGVQLGDPLRNGLAGSLAYTNFTDKIRYTEFANGRTALDPVNDSIAAYNALTRAGGGAPCYDPKRSDPLNGAQNAPDPACGSASIRNPYYDGTRQPLVNRNGWYDIYNEPGTPLYPPDNVTPVVGPHQISGYIDYRRGKFSIAPNFIFEAGGGYGSPTSIVGYDPRTCKANQRADGITSGDPLKADFSTCGPSAQLAGYLAIPDPFTGRFDGVELYRNPWQVDVGLQVQYAFSNNMQGTLILANMFQECFGGESTPWSRAFPPGRYTCAYAPNGSGFVSNFWNGASPNDIAANGMHPIKVATFPYAPLVNPSFTGLPPFNAYFSVQIKLR